MLKSLCWLLAGSVIAIPALRSQTQVTGSEWHFVVSGDSRNCGDIVMPEIAAAARANEAAFYWHLGDFRAIYDFDQDMLYARKAANQPPLTVIGYVSTAWTDFIENQLAPFGNIPVYLALGNHETIPPKTRNELIAQFADWLNDQAIREQRLKDNPLDHRVKTYYHFRRDGIEFITLDNASPEQFDAEQMRWFGEVLDRAASDEIRAVVVGLHASLPDSLASFHSMSDSLAGAQSGRTVYNKLLDFRHRHKKPVYVLASHSHFYMEGVYNSPYWREHGGELPGWIVGTAGAVRYQLPPSANEARVAKTKVYGYMLATVTHDRADPVKFTFHEIQEGDVLPDIVSRYSPEGVHECFAGNSN